jgi:hypothetical protein
LETFDELNNVQISSNIYKIFESVYERKKEFDEIKSNLNEINSSILEINYNTKKLIESINERLNTIYLDISSNMNSIKQESIQEISTIRADNLDLYQINKMENQKRLADNSNNKENLIYENLPDFNTLSYINKRNPNDNCFFDRNLINNFNTIKSNNTKNTINLNDESNQNIASKLLSSHKKQKTIKQENYHGNFDNYDPNEGRKIYVNNNVNHNKAYQTNNHFNENLSQNNNNKISNLGLIEKENEKDIDNNQYFLKRSLNRENSANKTKNHYSSIKKSEDKEEYNNENIITNIPSQIIISNEILSNKKISNQSTLNNNIATSNLVYSIYPSKNNDFIDASSQIHTFKSNQEETKRVIYKTGNTFTDGTANPVSEITNISQIPININENKQIVKNQNELILNNFNPNKDTKLIISLKENTNLFFVYNALLKEKCTYEVNFPLDSKENKFSWNCRLIQKDNDIFITGGHNDNNIPSKKCLYLNLNIINYFENNNYTQNNINITELKQMNFSRWAHSLILVQDRFLFCISGYNNKKCEFLDIQNNKWKNISDLNIWRMDPNLFIFNNSYIYVFGGFNDNNKFQKPFVKKIEKLKIFNKGVDFPSNINKWEFVNVFDDKGESNVNFLIPSMGIISLSDNKLLLVGGDTSDYSNFYEENSNRNNYNINENFGENHINSNYSNSFNKNKNNLDYHDNIYIVRINYLGNCEISIHKQKLNKACCFTTAKNFINCLDNFHCFDHSLDLCEIGDDILINH